MGRIVEVVVGAVARDPRHAWAQLVKLRQVESQRSLDLPPSEGLAELFRQLLDRYPPYEDDPHTPWGEFPMILYFGERLATISIVEGQVAEALPFVISTALRLGHTVFDETGERIHRPDGEQVLPGSVTAGSPRYDRLEQDAARTTAPKTQLSEAESKRKQRTGMIVGGGCLLALFALITLWTTLMLYSGWATSLAWGETDGPGNAILWVRDDVPLLVKMGIGALVAATVLLVVGVRRMKSFPGKPEPGATT